MGGAPGAGGLLVNQRDLSLAADAKLRGAARGYLERGNLCVSTDAAALRTDGKFRAVRTDADARHASLPEMAPAYGRSVVETWGAWFCDRRTVGGLGDVSFCDRVMCLLVVTGKGRGQAIRRHTLPQCAPFRGCLSGADRPLPR